MTPRSFLDEGIVLALRDYGEADRILSVFSRNHGKIFLIAKGVRKPKSRKRGNLSVFNCIKFQAAKGRSLHIITEVEIIDSFSAIRKDLKKVSLAYYFMEVVGKITREGEKHEECYHLLVQNLKKLKINSQTLKKSRLDFISELLVILGYWPREKTLLNPDAKLEEVVERNFSTVRVGKKILSSTA